MANAPDTDALSLATSEHFAHWLQNLADETGYTGDANHVDMKIEWAHQLGITDEELDAYVAMPETIGTVFTTLYYMRRSYEEGLAAFGWAGERFAASTGYAKKMYEGMRDHYGIEVENFRVHAYAEEDHGEQADYLLRQVVASADQQRRMRRADRAHLLGAQPAHGGAQPVAGRARCAASGPGLAVAAPAKPSSSTRCRTAFGKRGGALATWHPVDLLAFTLSTW